MFQNIYPQSQFSTKGSNAKFSQIFILDVLELLGLCKNDGKCEIFKAMKENCEFSQENYDHCEEFLHPKSRIVKCRYWDKCKAFKRLAAGGFRLADRCHMQVFRHPIRNRSNAEEM